MAIYKKRCCTINRKQICEGDTIITDSATTKVKGICGKFLVAESDKHGVELYEIAELKKAIKYTKFAVRKA